MVLGSVVVLLTIAYHVLMYKVKYGFAKNQFRKHHIEIPFDQPTILLFSKTTGFRHAKAIKASKSAFSQMVKRNDWFLYETENAGIFNEEELRRFDVVIWNNNTGRVLTDNQRILFENYIEDGGSYIGIHGAGDFSHRWDWYKNEVIGAEFSHHPIRNHIQSAEVQLQPGTDSLLSAGLPTSFRHDEEWYVFYDTPEKNGFKALYKIDGNEIDPNGNILFEKSKDFGMGANHPVAWYKHVGEGRVFYTSMGHLGEAFESENFMGIIENAVNWCLQ